MTYNLSSLSQFKDSTNLMNFIQLSKWQIFSGSIFLCCSQGVLADTIYQWTDTWGQVKYSKTNKSHVKLYNTDIKKLKLHWLPKKVVFSDGTSIEAK